MTIKLSSKGGGGLPRLAADLTFPSDKSDGGTTNKIITGIDVQGSLGTVLSAPAGPGVIGFLEMSAMSVNDIAAIRLTIDGDVIWDDAPTTNFATELYLDKEFEYKTSFLFEMNMTADTSITIEYNERPIL